MRAEAFVRNLRHMVPRNDIDATTSAIGGVSLIEVKGEEAVMSNTSDVLQANATSHAGYALTQSRHLRFAVGSFDTWLLLLRALDDLGRRNFALESFHCLALPHVLRARSLPAPRHIPARIEELAFPEGALSCTAGELCDRLRARLDAGARNLKEALGHWLIARHAAKFQLCVEIGKIQLWVELTDAREERAAYESLLACSSNSVGVHDLAPFRGGSGLGH
jgi:hypothetical protein